MNNFNYSKKVLDHFRNPHNLGKIDNADGVGQVGNIVCGDVMKLYIKMREDKIEDVKFETYGCAAAIATSSAVTDLAKGKTIDEVMKMNNQSILKSLGGLPPVKIHCSMLATEALKEAIYDYLVKTGKEIPEDLEKAHQRINR